MKKLLIVTTIVLVSISCTKDQDKPNNQEQTAPASEFAALKQEVEALKEQVDALGSICGAEAVSVAEFEKLKKENEELKATVATLTSTFFEVDGLRFDLNGTLISVPKLESKVVVDKGVQMGSRVTLTTTREYDAKGRVIEILNKYSGYSNSMSFSPYYWQKTMYEYNGKTQTTTVQTNKYGMGAGVPYEETITEATYW